MATALDSSAGGAQHPPTAMGCAGRCGPRWLGHGITLLPLDADLTNAVDVMLTSVDSLCSIVAVGNNAVLISLAHAFD